MTGLRTCRTCSHIVTGRVAPVCGACRVLAGPELATRLDKAHGAYHKASAHDPAVAEEHRAAWQAFREAVR